jgi:hypothetical protein
MSSYSLAMNTIMVPLESGRGFLFINLIRLILKKYNIYNTGTYIIFFLTAIQPFFSASSCFNNNKKKMALR